ncbi:protein CUSTOS [Triplophysa dalaica]|uniref:protein CUSTOS n=1 Tax=Triplophysa dalaica TaxID=1582913 RepID=UPI0024DFF544|nr:protein CUSTOS [Triplophysa dalaica]
MSESSSEEENADRFKEAAWSFGSQGVKICEEDKDSSGRQSHRTEVSKHEHDANELGTTPEFRSHVAKKLGAILDGCISEVFSDTVASQACPSKSTDEEEDEGFRLFFTSAPGKWMERELSPPPKKRRPVPSSSDSDSEMEMRFREAAVSVSDLLALSAPPVTEKKSGETEDGGENHTADTVPKKRKRMRKRKMATEASEKVSVQCEKQSNGDPDEQHTVTENLTKKKKKKKRKKLEDGGNGSVE